MSALQFGVGGYGQVALGARGSFPVGRSAMMPANTLSRSR
jgi:hypothetical protein